MQVEYYVLMELWRLELAVATDNGGLKAYSGWRRKPLPLFVLT